MPPKKPPPAQAQQGAGGGGILAEFGDPVTAAVAVVEKKARNLEKRKNKLLLLKESMDQGTQLDKDQKEAVMKLNEVLIQLELTKELQKQFATLSLEYQRARKKQQKSERQQQKDSEREAQKKAIAYTLRVQDILNNVDEEAKENFRLGTGGAVQLSEDELAQLDTLYQHLTPSRAENPSYQSDLETSGEHFLLLLEQSSRAVTGATYKDLSELILRIDQSGYFDKPTKAEEEEEDDDLDSDDAPEEIGDHVVMTTEGDVPANQGYDEEPDVQPEIETPVIQYEPPAEPQQPYVPPVAMVPSQPPTMPPAHAAITQQTMIGFVPSAPSPTFPGLGPSPIQPVHNEEFSFMHESEVDSRGLQQPPATTYPPATQQNIQSMNIVTPQGNVIPHPGQTLPQLQTTTITEQSNTDVATGQPSPNVESNPFQGKISQIAPGEQPPIQAFSGGQEEQSGYRQQDYNRMSGGAPPSSNRGGRGPNNRRGGGGGGPGSKSFGYQNGRGAQGYSSYGGAQNRGGYGGQKSGGRPNYRSAAPRGK